MTEWTKTGTVLVNDDRLYSEFLRKTGTQTVDHYGLIMFGDPKQEDFLRQITVSEHVFTATDSLSKIASKHYGEPRLWWVIAWFNTKPTDLHCEVGEKLFIPHPIGEVLAHAHKRVQ